MDIQLVENEAIATTVRCDGHLKEIVSLRDDDPTGWIERFGDHTQLVAIALSMRNDSRKQ